jgi:hypothetical protein
MLPVSYMYRKVYRENIEDRGCGDSNLFMIRVPCLELSTAVNSRLIYT